MAEEEHDEVEQEVAERGRGGRQEEAEQEKAGQEEAGQEEKEVVVAAETSTEEIDDLVHVFVFCIAPDKKD
ncbi:hypothetical protein PR001_g30170 [Phytophthora rubi]|uniref:Uncharacterized protein n=1 Tax=Phytophthora rubi TaxID=129364 RepID=A0A6A3HHD5_9STRA|nr:hypothetical protein PR001_g30170 [Phytophthora rubi]KAE8968362.1 hypothetical protein PR002_g27776 [Phytophthora rubi]